MESGVLQCNNGKVLVENRSHVQLRIVRNNIVRINVGVPGESLA